MPDQIVKTDTIILLIAIIAQIGTGYMQFGSLETKVDYIRSELQSIQIRTQTLDERLDAAEKEISLLKYILEKEGK